MLVQGQLVDNIGAALPLVAGRRCGNKGALLLNLLLCPAFLLPLLTVASLFIAAAAIRVVRIVVTAGTTKEGNGARIVAILLLLLAELGLALHFRHLAHLPDPGLVLSVPPVGSDKQT